MKKNKLVSLVLIFVLISCIQNPTKSVDNKSTRNEYQSNKNDDFVHFQSKFKLITLDKLQELGDQFNRRYLSNEDSLINVENKYRTKYIIDINSDYIYYGFKTELPNKSIVLTYLNHSGESRMRKSGEVIDTTFFTSIVYSASGIPLCSFRTFGSNLTGEPPTYNMTSIFEIEKNKLVITNYEYSTGKSYAEVAALGDDSIHTADLEMTKFSLDFTTKKISIINRIRRKATVIETYPETYPVYLKLIK